LSELEASTEAVYALAISPDGKKCFTCCSEGTINVWDLHNQKRIQSFSGHSEGASCIELSADQTKIFSGGLDKTVRIWDIATGRELDKFNHSSQVFALSASTDQNHIIVGLESSEIEHIKLGEPTNPRQLLRRHTNCVLSVKFAPSKKWFISTGKDGLLSGWQNPSCLPIFDERETSSILCAEISGCGNYVVTGSGDRRAALYSVII
jgi:groucho